jgi:hypothetical protein
VATTERDQIAAKKKTNKQASKKRWMMLDDIWCNAFVDAEARNMPNLVLAALMVGAEVRAHALLALAPTHSQSQVPRSANMHKYQTAPRYGATRS